MTTRSKLTVRLPKENLDFLKRYAADHGMTVTEVLDRFLLRLKQGEESAYNLADPVSRRRYVIF